MSRGFEVYPSELSAITGSDITPDMMSALDDGFMRGETVRHNQDELDFTPALTGFLFDPPEESFAPERFIGYQLGLFGTVQFDRASLFTSTLVGSENLGEKSAKARPHWTFSMVVGTEIYKIGARVAARKEKRAEYHRGTDNDPRRLYELSETIGLSLGILAAQRAADARTLGFLRGVTV